MFFCFAQRHKGTKKAVCGRKAALPLVQAPDFEQKGVDMRIGLDVATFSENKAVSRLIMITNDTDCAPAMKHARKAGLQIALMQFPNNTPATELLMHSDFRRQVAWPEPD